MATPTVNSTDPLQEEAGFLPDKPAHWTAWVFSWLIISVVLAALLGAIFVPLPEIVLCPYSVVIQGGSDPIQAPCNGVVRTVLVSEGERVNQGDPLFVISSDEVRGWDTERQTLQEDLKNHQADLIRDDAADAGEASIKEREEAQARDEITYRENYVATIHKLVDQLQNLSNSGAVSQEELITHQLELSTGEKDLSLSKKTLEQVLLQQKEMQTQHERRDGDAVADMTKIKVRLQALGDQMQSAQGNLRTIRAPYRPWSSPWRNAMKAAWCKMARNFANWRALERKCGPVCS